jgi:hypothetical protein
MYCCSGIRSTMCERSHPEFAARVAAVNSLTLLVLARALEPDTSLVVLDWQHQTYWRPP